MILEFTTQQEAATCLAFINQLAADYWTERGYTVIEENGVKQLIGKNAATGADEPNAQRTLSWDTVKQSPDNTFYFATLTGTPYAGAMEQLAENFTYVEKAIPAEWFPAPEV